MRTLIQRLRRALGPSLTPALLATVPLSYQTAIPPGGHGELDTPAVWIAPSVERSLLLVTDKTWDYVEIHDPVQNTYMGRFGGSGSAPGKLDRPNAVAVGYNVPTSVGPRDLFFVVERNNQRISAYWLPYALYMGSFGAGLLQEPMGIALHWEGAQLQAWVTDIGTSPQRVRVFDVVPAPAGIGGTLRLDFAPGSGSVLESIAIDPVWRRAIVCNEGASRDVMVFDLEGRLQTRFGAGRFVDDPEGIALFDAGNGTGYWIVTDQMAQPVEFEVFDRQDFRWLRSFSGPTQGTDGVALTQMALPNFPQGSFFAVHSDATVHAYDWTNIARSTGLCVQQPCWPVDAGDPAGALGPSRLEGFPNPVATRTTIRYQMTAPGPVEAAVYDPRGSRVALLYHGTLPAGSHALAWDGRGTGGLRLPAGVYVVRVRAGGREDAYKLTLLR